MPATDPFQQAMEAARSGKPHLARDLLGRLIRGDPKNPAYWIWMSAVAADRKEKILCLEHALSLDPGNEVAKRGLVILGSARADRTELPEEIPQTILPVPPRLQQQARSVRGLPQSGPNWIGLAAGIVGAVLIIGAVLLLGYAAQGVVHRLAQGPPTPTRLPTSSPTPSPRPSPTLRTETVPLAGTPLAVFLGVSTTPTPLYAATPHPIAGAYSLAMQAYASGAWDTAETYFKQALVLDPKSPDLHYWIGEAYRRSLHPTEAVSEYATASALDPQFAPSRLGMAYLDLGLGAQADALEQLNRALELDPNFAEAYLVRAGLLTREGDAQGAFADLQRAVQVDPQNALALALLGEDEVKRGDLEAAWRAASRSQALDPTELESYRALGEVYLAMGLPKEAESQLQVYTTYAGKEARGWVDLGDAALALGDFRLADSAYGNALQQDSGLQEGWVGRSEALRGEAKYTEAATLAAQAATLFPDSSTVLTEYGHALISAGQAQEAVAVLTGALAKTSSPQDQGAMLSLRAEAYRALGDTGAAAKDWNQLIGLSGVSERVRLDAYDELRAMELATPTAAPTSGS